MKMDLAALWAKVLETVEQEIPRPSFETWIKPTRPVAFYEDLIIVAAPNDLAKTRLESHYSEPLKEALQTVSGRNLRLSFVLPSLIPNDLSFLEELAPASAMSTPALSGDLSFKPLNQKYTFETFVVGNSNRFAHAASLAVAETPARAYNPLFIYGGVGLGKTHLMHAIGHFVLTQNPSIKVAYLSSETFTNEFINSLRDNKTVEFQNRYRHVDILLIDDIQFLAGKERTQEEFYHTFNAIHEAHKQIVINSDRPPKEIPTLEERLRSRFEWGLICDIQPPDLETRIAILRKKCQADRLVVSDDVLAWIAARISTNIRELEGALTRFFAYTSYTGRPLNTESVAEALKDILPFAHPREITISLIQQAVAQHYGLRLEDFKIRKRTRALAFPRQVAMYLSRELTTASLPKIGEEFGGRDHTTVLHACDKISSDMGIDPLLAATIRQISTRLKSNGPVS